MSYKELYNNLIVLFNNQQQAKDAQIQELTDTIKVLGDRIAILTQNLYGGSKSEKVRVKLPKNTLESTAPAAIPNVEINTPDSNSLSSTKETAPTTTKRETVERRDYTELIEKTIEIPAAPHPDSAKLIGYKESIVIKYIPPQLIRLVYKRPIYVKDDIFYIPELPELPLNRSYADATLLAAILNNKYRNHLPIERQLEMFKTLGINIAKSTMHNWVSKSLDLLLPLADKLKKEMLACKYLNIDETIIPIMTPGGGKCKKGYVWGITSKKEKLIWFHYKNGSRDQDVLKDLFKDYTGAIQSDDFSSYKLLEKKEYKDKILMLSCLAHVRRKIYESIPRDNRAQQLFNLINDIYHQEHLWQKENKDRELLKKKPLTEKEIRDIRNLKELPILEQISALIDEHLQDKTILPKSTFGKAVAYAKHELPGIFNCLKSGDYSLDNNPIERQFKDMIVGRKNYLFCEGHKSAERAAAIYSLIGCCKLRNIDPYTYLTDVFNRINKHDKGNLVELLPHKWTKSEEI